MSLRRNIIAFIMLLTYTVSFAHDIIPHNHSESPVLNGVEYSEHTTQSHYHVSGQNSENNHSVQHSDHLDNGLFDYVVCLLESVHHGVTNDHDVTISQSDSFQIVQTNCISLTSINSFTTNVFNYSLKESIANSYFNQQSIPAEIYLDCSVLRGPPVFSC